MVYMKSKLECEISDDPATSFTLPSHFYFDKDVFDEEYNRIFFRSWHYTCHISELDGPGSYVTTKIGNQHFFVTRNKTGDIRAFSNVCRHRGHVLLTGSGKRRLITCPYHSWTYNLDGKLVSPGCSGFDGIKYEEFGLSEIRVEAFLGFVFINMDPSASSFASQVPGLEDDLRRRVARLDELVIDENGSNQGPVTEGDMKCNWKLLAENYQECYHCSAVHPGISALHDTTRFILELSDNFTVSTIPLRDDLIPGETVYPVSDEDEQRDACFWYVWPNVAFTSLSGRPNLSVLRLDPVGPELTSNYLQVFHLVGDQSEGYLKRGEWMAAATGPEDQAVLESTQLGLHQRSFSRGHFIYRADPAIIGGSGERGPHWIARKIARAFEAG
jgi:nitrite reductase/ring-hydroxylating ferredoxin subunit